MRLRYAKLSVKKFFVIAGALLLCGILILWGIPAIFRVRVGTRPQDYYSPATARKHAIESFRKQWGRVPEPGELFDPRLPLAIPALIFFIN